jgi:2-succinyl-5-enolpyruvyl-6-hydroxy-3-cyclohexene-1-carboxylate synthase
LGTESGEVYYGDVSNILDEITPKKIEWENGCIAPDALFLKVPYSEPALIRQLSEKIQKGSHIYLGNSMAIRNWDLAATLQDKGFVVTASRGLNGIDGQVATFLGRCYPDRDNWAILGDLTALYDIAGFWGLKELADYSINIVVVNNGGGKIFSQKFSQKSFQCPHTLSFKAIGDFWNISYQKLLDIQYLEEGSKHTLVELIPDNSETDFFWLEWKQLLQKNGLRVPAFAATSH